MFSNLKPPYDLLMIDPPWRFETFSKKGITKKGAEGNYVCMDPLDLCQLQVASLCAKDAICLLWTTNPLLPLGIKTLEAWGFDYKTAAHWVKRTRNDKLAFGTGYILRCAGEPILIGTRGKPRTGRSTRSIFEGPIREHSRKPDEAYAWAESLMPAARKVDLFARETRPGWDAWGDEKTKFDAL